MSHSKALSILTLFLLSVGCLTANSPMRRSISVDADGKTGTEIQSLIELANIHPGEETEATQSLLMLAANLDPGASKADMHAFIDELKSNVTSWYSDANARVEKSIDPIRQCATTKEEKVAHSLTQKDKCDAKSNEHKLCRKEESKLLIAAEDLKELMAEKKEIMDTECKIFSDVEAESKAATAFYSHPSPDRDEESYLERVCDEFSALLPRYEEAKEKCETAKAEYARVSALYEKAHAKYILQVTTCNAIQTKLDVVCCKYALTTKDICDFYGTCYEDKVLEHKSLKGEVKREAGVQEVTWRVCSRIECLLDVLGSDDHAGIEACRKKIYQVPHSIGDPAIPAKGACAVEAAYPGTDAYYKAQIVPLPSNAKGQPVAACAGMTGGPAEAAPPCHAKIDVVLALDESGSMRSYMDNFKAFAEHMVDAMTLGGDHTRVAVVGFAEDATVHESWSTDASQIKAGIGKLNAGGYTSISGSIDEAIQQFDSHGRSDATKVIILLSDGEQTDHLGGKAAALAAAERAKANDIIMFAWGFGAVSMETLKDIASEPSKAFFRDSVPDLIEHINGLQSDVCGSAREASWEWKFGNNGCARCDAWCPHGSVDNINYGGRGSGFGRSCQNNDGTYPCGNEVAGDNGACHQCKCKKAPECEAKSTSTADAGYSDSYRGWYDVQGCGKCLDYCRWVGNSGSGGNPEAKLQHGSSWWSCRLAGDSSAYSGQSHFSSWSYNKCSGEGAAP